MPELKILAVVLVLLGVAGCIGTKAPPGKYEGPPAFRFEREHVVEVAYDHAVETGEIDLDSRWAFSRLTNFPGRPTPGGHPWGRRWIVYFELMNAFNEPSGEASVAVLRYDEGGKRRYEAR